MKNQRKLQIGCATFRADMAQTTKKRLFTKEIIDTLKDDNLWWLCLGIYKEKWTLIFQLMQETSVLKLQLGRNEDFKIMKNITSINFTHLKALCFGKNKIVNIEQIQYIKAPNLEWLSFGISHPSLRGKLFDKCSITKEGQFSKLEDTQPQQAFSDEETNKLNSFDLREFHAPELNKVTTELYIMVLCSFHTDETQGQALQWLFTLQSRNLLILRNCLRELGCRSDTRIKSTPINIALKAKYPLLNMKSFDINNVDAEEDSESDHA